MTLDIENKLESFAKSFIPTLDLVRSKSVFDEVKQLKLGDTALVTAFLINADLSDPKTKKLIAENFGQKVAENIELLHRIGKVQFLETTKNIASLRKHFIELTEEVEIIFIKLAERLCNLNFADKEKHEDILKLSEEALYLYSPIAQQLGIRKFYTEMEDIAFRNLFPDDFNYLEKMIEAKRNVFNAKLNSMRHDLNKVLEKYSIKAKFQARVKRPYSIYRKLKKQKIPLDKIYDLLALRVIIDTVEHCYLTLGAVHSNWIPIDGRFRDWISFPKANGYRSIQTTVVTRNGDKFEIQIRTEDMHQEAEYGSSAHWAYKQGAQTTTNSWIVRLREFLENEEYFDNPYEVFDKLKSEMKRDYINVLTPKGEIFSLPEGSTPLDYSFSVHTDLGYRTTGARVNGKFVKLNTELKSGDVIDIISSKNSSPSRDWLKIVKTNRARSKILRWFKKNEQEVFIFEGKVAWEKLKTKNVKKLKGFDDENKFKSGLNKLGYKSPDEFYYAIANGSAKCSLFTLKRIYPDAFRKKDDNEKKSRTSNTKDVMPKISVEGMSGIETILAKCCNPIKGEPVIAYITKRSELKIHSANCQYLKTQNLDQSNFKKAEWTGGESYQVVKLRIFGESYSNLLSIVVDEADQCKLRIMDSSRIVNRAATTGLLLEIEVNDINQLTKFTNKLKNHKSVESVKSV
ncbi:MAG: bifunctional (p)ppGpp synthetase/guanosine-3',5'-bis(diphosphate) 3'-pyrophosphohydrolase [Desulfobulbaceae bacterium]|nr:bifunctional (p)ppGpp synthetase/guanosine-3',5'-bis(diphosphate) 3'-pyrophosphohydrolase [Candidatus Kapabacteria bacterium]MBS4000225.1 bifunctional (p)ppGpp synthetase/guanosine-3',5'-bis(diphosphate) 3'-pyrophosphohydrolase [Desulfobulbaceae bacterium]